MVGAAVLNRREHLADWLIIIGGLGLLGSLFVTWSHQFSAGFLSQLGGSAALDGLPRDPNAWQVYSVMDVALAALAVALVAVALVGDRPVRLVALLGVAVGVAFTVHALADPPTSGATVFDPAASVPHYVANSPRAGTGEIVALAAFGVATAGIAISLTVD